MKNYAAIKWASPRPLSGTRSIHTVSFNKAFLKEWIIGYHLPCRHAYRWISAVLQTARWKSKPNASGNEPAHVLGVDNRGFGGKNLWLQNKSLYKTEMFRSLQLLTPARYPTGEWHLSNFHTDFRKCSLPFLEIPRNEPESCFCWPLWNPYDWMGWALICSISLSLTGRFSR